MRQQSEKRPRDTCSTGLREEGLEGKQSVMVKKSRVGQGWSVGFFSDLLKLISSPDRKAFTVVPL